MSGVSPPLLQASKIQADPVEAVGTVGTALLDAAMHPVETARAAAHVVSDGYQTLLRAVAWARANWPSHDE